MSDHSPPPPPPPPQNMESEIAEAEKVKTGNLEAKSMEAKNMQFEMLSSASTLQALASLLNPEEEDDFDFEQVGLYLKEKLIVLKEAMEPYLNNSFPSCCGHRTVSSDTRRGGWKAYYA